MIEWSVFFQYLLMLSLVLVVIGVAIAVIYESILDSRIKHEIKRLEAEKTHRLKSL